MNKRSKITLIIAAISIGAVIITVAIEKLYSIRIPNVVMLLEVAGLWLSIIACIWASTGDVL